MMCTNPVRLKKYTVPCGKCLACLQKKQSNWAVRIEEEAKTSSSSWFITLTYNDENVPLDGDTPVLCKRDVQLFLKRLRKSIEPIRIRFFLCGEYGTKTLRPHYHLILFNINFYHNDIIKIVEKSWTKGHIMVDKVTTAHCYYVAKYTNSPQLLSPYYRTPDRKPFLLMSRRPGIGIRFIEDYQIRQSYRSRPRAYLTRPGGIKVAMPRYYKDKLYDDEMKEQLKDQLNELLIKKQNETPIIKTVEDLQRSITNRAASIALFEEKVKKSIMKGEKL